MKKLPVVAAAIFLSVILFSARTDALADRDGWTSLKKDVYINKKSMAYTSADTVSLWVKIIPGQRSELLSEEQGRLTDKGKLRQALLYEYTGYLSEIDCARKRHREFVAILYDVNKNIIDSVEYSRASWKDILPESSFQLVQTAVCD
jgi:hypothetical protein